MSALRIHTLSLGCPKNLVDTEHLLGAVSGGVEPVDDPRDAEVVLVNTCAFIRPAVEESVAALVELAETLKDMDIKPMFVAAGCLVARYGAELAEELPEVDLWLLPGELEPWRKAMRQRFGDNTPSFGRVRSTPPGYAYLKIGEGCDHACRYCIIPKLRGRLSSLDDRDIVSQAKELLQGGVKELIVVAQDVTAHGRDRNPDDPHALQRLLEKLLPLDGLEWLRLMYLYPSGLTNELLDFLRQAGKPFLPYFDIPLQHVHPAVLERMGRPHGGAVKGRGSEPPQAVLERVRARFPEAVIRSTFIVGYPGEEEEHFQTLMRFVERERLHHVGVFGFHAEEGTAAARLKGKVPAELKEKRRGELMALQREISMELLEDCVAEQMDVLVDAVHDEWPGLHVGRVWSQAPEVDGSTYVSGSGVRPGAMVKAEIMEAQEYDLIALTAKG